MNTERLRELILGPFAEANVLTGMRPTVKSEPYKLELITDQVDRTHWWKNEDRKESADVWWLTGGGLSRPATDVEIELWKRIQAAEAERLEMTNACAEAMRL